MIPGPWVIDSLGFYDTQLGVGCKPESRGAVIAECPTAFGTITVRAPATAGQKCPSVAEMDASGIAHATAIAAVPEILAALEAAEVALTQCRPFSPHLPGIRSAIQKAKPR